MKRILAYLCICAALLCGLRPLSAAADGYRRIPITYEGRTVMGGEALLIDSVTYVPFRAVCDTLGEGQVGWDDRTKTATFVSTTLTLTAKQGASYIVANGRYLYCANGIKNIGSRIYVPIRPMAKAFGVEVLWDPAYRITLRGGEPLATGESYYDSEALYWLSRIISAEARGESLRGQIAVGNVVLNRVAHPAFPTDVKGVIFAEGQFSPVKSGSVYEEPTEMSVIAAKLCLDGAVVVEDALFFCNPAIATSTWMQEHRHYVMTLGNHTFYR